MLHIVFRRPFWKKKTADGEDFCRKPDFYLNLDKLSKQSISVSIKFGCVVESSHVVRVKVIRVKKKGISKT